MQFRKRVSDAVIQFNDDLVMMFPDCSLLVLLFSLLTNLFFVLCLSLLLTLSIDFNLLVCLITTCLYQCSSCGAHWDELQVNVPVH